MAAGCGGLLASSRDSFSRSPRGLFQIVSTVGDFGQHHPRASNEGISMSVTVVRMSMPMPAESVTQTEPAPRIYKLKTPDPAIGSIFGRLTVVSDFYTNGKERIVSTKCVCGTEKEVSKGNLLSGRVNSCGCLAAELTKERCTTHGLTKSPIYAVWNMMRQRCQVPTNKQYADYGGRGITVSNDWPTFEGFFKDMGDQPFKGAMVERIDNDGPYSKENCVWADRKTQNNNKRSNILWEYKGHRYSTEELAELSGLNPKTLNSRLYGYKWSVERAVETPVISRSESANMAPETGPAATRHKLYPTQP